MIDEFEDERIDDPARLKATLDFLQHSQDKFTNGHLLSVLADMFEKALKSQTGVYFYF